MLLHRASALSKDPILTAPDLHARIAAYVTGDMPADARRAFEADMANDPALAAEVEGLRATQALLDADVAFGAAEGLDEPPPHLLGAILAAEPLARSASVRAAGAQEKPTPWTQRLSMWLTGGGLVAAAAALLFFAWNDTWLDRAPPTAEAALSKAVQNAEKRAAAPKKQKPQVDVHEDEPGLDDVVLPAVDVAKPAPKERVADVVVGGPQGRAHDKKDAARARLKGGAPGTQELGHAGLSNATRPVAPKREAPRDDRLRDKAPHETQVKPSVSASVEKRTGAVRTGSAAGSLGLIGSGAGGGGAERAFGAAGPGASGRGASGYGVGGAPAGRGQITSRVPAAKKRGARAEAAARLDRVEEREARTADDVFEEHAEMKKAQDKAPDPVERVQSVSPEGIPEGLAESTADMEAPPIAMPRAKPAAPPKAPVAKAEAMPAENGLAYAPEMDADRVGAVPPAAQVSAPVAPPASAQVAAEPIARPSRKAKARPKAARSARSARVPSSPDPGVIRDAEALASAEARLARGEWRAALSMLERLQREGATGAVRGRAKAGRVRALVELRAFRAALDVAGAADTVRRARHARAEIAFHAGRAAAALGQTGRARAYLVIARADSLWAARANTVLNTLK